MKVLITIFLFVVAKTLFAQNSGIMSMSQDFQIKKLPALSYLESFNKTKDSVKNYFVIVETDLYGGINSWKRNFFSVNLIFEAIKVTPDFKIGFGFGTRYYYELINAKTIPFFLNFSLSNSKKRISPSISTKVGCFVDRNYDANYDLSYGFFFNPNIGFRVRVSKLSELKIGIGYEIQNGHYFQKYSIFSKNDILNYYKTSIGFAF